MSYSVRPRATTGEAIEIPVEARLASNAFASVVLVRGRTGEGDPGRPRFRMGVVDLVVEAGDRRLTVAVETDRPSYQPGDRVRAGVRVSGSGGQPVRAELALAVADEGVLQILGFKTPDPLPAFYAPWGLGVESAGTGRSARSPATCPPPAAPRNRNGSPPGPSPRPLLRPPRALAGARRSGRWHPRPEPSIIPRQIALQSVLDWIAHGRAFWTESVERLEDLLEKMDA